MTRKPAIRDLLQQMPLERLAAATRRRLAAAGNGGSEAEIHDALRTAAGELLRGGDLIRVSIEGGGGLRGPLFLLRGTSELFDLGCLAPAAHPADPVPTPAPSITGESGLAGTNGDVGAVLEAMEQAQDLAVGDPRADEPAVVVDRIVALVSNYVPQVTIVAQLHGDQSTLETTDNLLPPLVPASTPFWLQQRQPGQALWIPDVKELPEPLQKRLGEVRRAGAVTAVVPMWSPVNDADEVGLLYVASVDDWTGGDLLKLAHRLSAFVSRRWRCQRDVNLRVLTDSLTGIHNRAFFDSQFPLELERARRGDMPLTLAIGDLDHFKAVNDTYGHQCGDLVLREVARQLQMNLRRIDHVCRIGGEEFAFILPYTSAEEANGVLSRVVGRTIIVSLPPELGVGDIGVTVSFGAVTFPDAGASAGELHRKADSMLYRAKELGRNRCCLWCSDGRHQQLLPAPPPAAEA